MICECALCTFPDKTTAMAEMARLLRPGGRLGVADVAANRSCRNRAAHPPPSRVVDQIGAILDLLKLTSRSQIEALGVDFGRVGPVLDATRVAVADGVLDYVLLVAEKPCR